MPKKSKQSIPKHLGLIIDGNRRWAKERGISTLEGHKEGSDNLKVIAEAAWDRGVEIVSAYVFSTENWNRSKKEIDYLMKLLIKLVDKEIEELEKRGAKILIVGSMEGLTAKVGRAMLSAQERTKNNDKGILALCFNYGGHREITDAVKSIVKSGVALEDIDEELISKNLYEPEIPPVDLIIRTSGEKRLSNFMLWRAAYSELYFSDKYWPDFTEKDLDDALEEYASRQRRFGA